MSSAAAAGVATPLGCGAGLSSPLPLPLSSPRPAPFPSTAPPTNAVPGPDTDPSDISANPYHAITATPRIPLIQLNTMATMPFVVNLLGGVECQLVILISVVGDSSWRDGKEKRYVSLTQQEEEEGAYSAPSSPNNPEYSPPHCPPSEHLLPRKHPGGSSGSIASFVTPMGLQQK